MREANVKATAKVKRKPRKPAKKIVMAIRVTEEELKNFDERFVVNGTLRSEVMRRKLEITKTRRAKRGTVSEEAAYDYMRGILLKSSLIKISALVDSLNRFDDTSQLVEAARNIRKIVVAEVAKMNREISALQLRSGVTDLNPVQEMEFGVLEYLEPKT
jgi:hypothetical protein